LAIATTTTGGTAVTAINTNGRVKGGWLQNPFSATTDLCVNEFTTATISGATCTGSSTATLRPGDVFFLSPSTLGVSVVSSDNSHAYVGVSYQ
jgi:hypothetical protein